MTSKKFKLNRIRIKLFATILAVLTVFLILISIFSTTILFRVFSLQTYQRLSTAADQIKNCIPDSAAYYFDIYSIAINNNITFEIINTDGTISYSSQNNSSAQSSEHFASSAQVYSEYSSTKPSNKYKQSVKKQNFEIRNKSVNGLDYFVYSTELDTAQTVYLYSSVADVENIVDVSGKVFSVICISLIILTSVIFYIIVTRFTKPLVEMSDITQEMAALNFTRKCGNYGKDEIGDLGKAINVLSDALNDTLTDLKGKNEQLEKDIERRHQLDNARKSFISNVSHELKTPIAIISGYAEGLCAGISDDPDVIKEYCQIINDESRKMNTLVVELLELSKLESRDSPFKPDKFDIGRKISDLIVHLSIITNGKDITIENRVPESLICYGQHDKIEIVLKNYITNAISHCDGEKKIIIDYSDKGNVYEFSVFNTGSHIDPHDMSEIWDSFYRADKAHGRRENRFGLGLSIVKSILTNHSCSYGAENVENGVKFTFQTAKDSTYYEKKN